MFNAIMVFRRTGPGLNMAEPSNLSRLFTSSAGMLATSLADFHSARS